MLIERDPNNFKIRITTQSVEEDELLLRALRVLGEDFINEWYDFDDWYDMVEEEGLDEIEADEMKERYFGNTVYYDDDNEFIYGSDVFIQALLRVLNRDRFSTRK